MIPLISGWMLHPRFLELIQHKVLTSEWKWLHMDSKKNWLVITA